MKEWIEKIRRFLVEVNVELKRTTWPNRLEVQGTTMVVIITVFIFSVFLFGVDWLLGHGVTWLFGYFR